MNKHVNLEYLNTFVIAAETGKLNVTSELVFDRLLQSALRSKFLKNSLKPNYL